MIKEKILKNLICLDCHKKINLDNNKLVCSSCGKVYQIIDDKLYILDNKVEILNEESNDAIINKLKILFKKYPKLFLFYTMLLELLLWVRALRRQLKISNLIN